MDHLLIYGLHSVQSALRHHPAQLQELWLAVHKKNDQAILRIAEQAAQLKLAVNWSDAKTLDRKVAQGHQGVIARRLAIRPALEDDLVNLQPSQHSLLLALDGIQDPQNFGACLRVSDAAGAAAVITPHKKAVGMSGAVHRASAGAAETVHWVQVRNMVRSLEKLKSQGYWVVGATQDAEQSLFDLDLQQPICFVMGSEGQGLRQLRRQTCDHLVHLPMHGAVQSLNVSVATGICLYSVLQQRNKI